ncbi:MAG TPA: hypothetical protein DCM08_10680 [Microscillaceae bacterium]|jgi:antitoxin component YwqK of YwqJK toxin-antitoxin module|nr:hypothetical protein [Microscillaceae bacterium]
MIKTILIYCTLFAVWSQSVQAQRLKQHYYDNGNLRAEGIVLDNGLEHGLWTRYFENGKIEIEISYKAGVKHGPFISYFESGQIESMGAYRDGKLEGPLIFLHESSQKVESMGKAANGHPFGEWDLYDEAGNRLKTVTH